MTAMLLKMTSLDNIKKESRFVPLLNSNTITKAEAWVAQLHLPQQWLHLWPSGPIFVPTRLSHQAAAIA